MDIAAAIATSHDALFDSVLEPAMDDMISELVRQAIPTECDGCPGDSDCPRVALAMVLTEGIARKLAETLIATADDNEL